MANGASFAMDEKKSHHLSKNKKKRVGAIILHTTSARQARGYAIKRIYDKA